MIGKITDENSMRKIVTNGIIPAIGNVLKSEGTVDSKIAEITNLVNAYNDFYLTGRRIEHQGESEGKE